MRIKVAEDGVEVWFENSFGGSLAGQNCFLL
jgi:hypothetical protein